MDRRSRYLEKIPKKYVSQLTLLGIRIDTRPVSPEDPRPYSAEKLIDGHYANLCKPIEGAHEKRWPIVQFSTISGCCIAAINPKKYGYAWDNSNENDDE